MKKIFSVILIVTMLLGTLALAACETPPENNPNTPGNNNPPYANEVELMMLGSQKTAEAFAKQDAFTAFLNTVKNPRIDLTADLTQLLGVSVDATMLCGDDFFGFLLNSLSFPSYEDDYVTGAGGSSVTLSDMGIYITKDELALSVPMLLGEGYYGIKYENVLTFLESILGPIPEDERPEVEATFNKIFDLLGGVTLESVTLPAGFTAFLSNLLKEKASLTKTEANGNVTISITLTEKGIVDIVEATVAELRKDEGWKKRIEEFDALLKMANEDMSIDALIAQIKDSLKNAPEDYEPDLRSITVTNVYDSQLRALESVISVDCKGTKLDVINMVAQYGEFSKMTTTLSIYEEYELGFKKECDLVIAYEEKVFDANKKGFSFKMSIPEGSFGTSRPADPESGNGAIIGGDDLLMLSTENADTPIEIEIDYYIDSSNNKFKLRLSAKQDNESLFSAALLGTITLENNALTLSVTEIETESADHPGVTVNITTNITVKISEMSTEDKVVPTYKDFTTIPPETIDSIMEMISGLLGGTVMPDEDMSDSVIIG